MLSIETRDYNNGECWFAIRHWDGIDRPEYYKLFRIDIEEMNLNNGRFARMKRFDYIYDDEQMIEIIPPKTPEEIIIWIHENTTDLWNMRVDYGMSNSTFWYFCFLSIEDATGFKLRWLNAKYF